MDTEQTGWNEALVRVSSLFFARGMKPWLGFRGSSSQGNEALVRVSSLFFARSLIDSSIGSSGERRSSWGGEIPSTDCNFRFAERVVEAFGPKGKRPMGSILSLLEARLLQLCKSSKIEEDCKRLRMSSNYDSGNTRLIPRLPDEISLEILARVPRICYLNMKMVSRRWRAALSGAEVYQSRKAIGRTEEWVYILTKVEEGKPAWHALDPLSGRWQRLPPMPNPQNFRLWPRVLMDPSTKFADTVRGWLGTTGTSINMPFYGCGVGTVDGCLYVLGGLSSSSSAIKSVWRYDPCANSWQESSPMTTGRAFCKTSVLDDKLYVVGGVTRGDKGLTSLRSAEVYDPRTGLWAPVPSMLFSKFTRPVAAGATTYKGRLCVPQNLYCYPFYVDVGGEMYDPKSDTWVDMPAGMGKGWPGKQAEASLSIGSNLSTVLNGELYALDPCGAQIKVYDEEDDAWKAVMGRVPVHNWSNFGAPYMLVSLLGKLHVIAKEFNNDTRVLRADPKHSCSSSSSSSSSSSAAVAVAAATFFSSQNGDKLAEAEPNLWEVIAAKNFGTAQFVACRVLSV
ncbi:hypothetical protein OPV22_026759 [Ensete ventricosum]|uniref:F-box domain-containing protein n=1 Tax=Ensete ventricosum TaxID=4639 RepID=A0AAV8P296_ENSVE|nr:hypothetical protein OPV22_026759 [Ensete ventricosum]